MSTATHPPRTLNRIVLIPSPFGPTGQPPVTANVGTMRGDRDPVGSPIAGGVGPTPWFRFAGRRV